MRLLTRQRKDPETHVSTRFESLLQPHLGAAYNLARWLMKNDQDAEDMVQDACLQALRAYDSFRGENFRAWLLRIVRNTCYTRLRSQAASGCTVLFDDELHDVPDEALNPAAVLLHRHDAEQVREAIESLPAEFREVLILRELEEMSYREIAAMVAIPLGTVMSRLARARQHLKLRMTGMIVCGDGEEQRP